MFLPVVRPKMRCIMAVIDQKESLLAVACTRLLLLVFYTSRCVPCCRSLGPDALHHGRYGPDVLGHGCSHPVVRNDICLWSRLLLLRSLRSCSPSRSSTSLLRRRGSLSWSRQFVRPQIFPSCCTRWSTSLLCMIVQIFLSWCRCRFPWSRGFVGPCCFHSLSSTR